MTIKAISLWQPWATAWVIGLKKAETRHWAPVTFLDRVARGYGGPLAIHAAKTDRDPNTGEYFDDTRKYVDALPLSAGDKHKIYEANARRVYPRLDALLTSRGI